MADTGDPACAAFLGRICTHCAYNVSGLPDTSMCPQCGNRIDLKTDKRLWENVRLHERADAGLDDASPLFDRETFS